MPRLNDAMKIPFRLIDTQILDDSTRVKNVFYEGDIQDDAFKSATSIFFALLTNILPLCWWPSKDLAKRGGFVHSMPMPGEIPLLNTSDLCGYEELIVFNVYSEYNTNKQNIWSV